MIPVGESSNTWNIYIWSNYSDLTRPHPKWWLSKGNPFISGKPRLVKYFHFARYMEHIYMGLRRLNYFTSREKKHL